jgi:hypothetical protein
MEIYKPHMDGQAPPAAGVADTIGAFTTSIHVAQNMFLASLPCWLIQESKTFGDKKIFSVAEIFHLKDYIVLVLQTIRLFFSSLTCVFLMPSIFTYLNMSLPARIHESLNIC